jgi:hypothetical protein
VPGTYRVRLTLGGQPVVRTLDVLPDPRAATSAEAFRGQQEMLEKVYARIDEIQASARRLRAAREQVQALIARTKEHPAADTIAKAGRALSARIDSLEGLLVNARNKTFQDVVNYAPGLNAQFQALAQAIDGTDAPVTGGVRTRLADLEAEWAGLRQRVDGVLGADVIRLNALVREKDVPAVTP